MEKNTPSKKNKELKFYDHHEELKLRMEHYHKKPDLMTILQNAFQNQKDEFTKHALNLGYSFFNEQGEFKGISSITLSQIENVTRQMDSCGYEFLESGLPDNSHSFYKYMPLKYQPFLDELFEFALHRELETIQYYIQDFIHQSHLSYDEINALDFGEIEVDLTTAEKVSQGLYISAYELIEREYILFAVSKIRKYNPHRAFHRLYELKEEDKHIIMDYIRYIIQGDYLVTAGEISFVEKVVPKLKMEKFDLEEYKEKLTQYPSVEELQPITTQLFDTVRRQILGLVVDCAYSDRMLHPKEQPRILEIARIILGNGYFNSTYR